MSHTYKMLEDTLENVAQSLFIFLTGRPACSKGLLVKKHVENLQTHGDFSFPSSSKSWVEHIDKQLELSEEETVLQVFGKKQEDIVTESLKWNIQIKSVKEEKGRVYVYLERPVAISVGLAVGLRNAALISEKLKLRRSYVKIDPLSENTDCLTYLRVKYLSNVIENLCSILVNHEQMNLEIFVTSKSSSTCDGYKVLCSTVLSSKTNKKESDIGANDFIRSRQEQMSLIAQHKYGVRVTTDCKWKEFIKHLGESAAAFELLEVKPTSVVKINCDNMSGGVSKGAAFILYNCARLETIMRTYEEKVQQGIYPPLPDFNEIDFTLLTQEDEWTLIFNYIMGFPSMLDSSMQLHGGRCEFRPHFICSFLCSLVRVFSQYYRRTRILVEARAHLLPTVYARMHMLRILNDTLKTCLKILNIKSVSQM